MKTYTVYWRDDVTKSAKVEASSPEEAIKKIEDGNFNEKTIQVEAEYELESYWIDDEE